jgi:nucleoside-diphosphate-sugar epimerase
MSLTLSNFQHDYQYSVMERISSPPKSSPPKIVVLGATGKIGRRVIRQLMALESDMTIVAFVRDYEKACDVLYDELIIEKTTKGPTLQVVVMDLVPPSFVAGYKPDEDEDDDGDDDDEAIISASRFYANDAADYDFRSSKEEDAIDLNPYLPLQGK